MKKRLIALMCAGIIGLTSLVGCTEQGNKEFDMADEYENFPNVSLVQEDTNIVIDINGTAKLHKGDVYAIDSNSKWGGGLGFNILEFDCGEKLNCTYPFSFGKEVPNPQHYDEVCEDCFGNNN